MTQTPTNPQKELIGPCAASRAMPSAATEPSSVAWQLTMPQGRKLPCRRALLNLNFRPGDPRQPSSKGLFLVRRCARSYSVL